MGGEEEDEDEEYSKQHIHPNNRIMSLSLLPSSIVKIYMSKFLALEKSRFILIGIVISLSVLIPTMIVFGMWYGILGVATSFVLATIIQAVYFFIASKIITSK